jgi:hypothetical protein
MALPDLTFVLVADNPELCCAMMDSYIFPGVSIPEVTCQNNSIKEAE